MRKILFSYLLMISMALNAQINLGTGSTTVGLAPVATNFNYSYVQQIFTKQEINANAAGDITGLKFYLDPLKSIDNSSKWVVYLGQTSASYFNSGQSWVPVSELTQMYGGTVTNINGVVEITFTTPFPYNNIDNLVVAVDENSSGNDDEAMYVYPSATGSTLYFANDVINPNPNSPFYGKLTSYKSVITFNGLTAKGVPACPTIMYPSNNAIAIPLSPTITWYNSLGATGYKVSVGTTPGGTDIINQQQVTTNNFSFSTPLTQNTDYYLKIVALGAAGESSGCSETVFKTIPPLPSNDECFTAITLPVNPDLNCGIKTSGYTIGATDSGVPASCSGIADDDVWYKFVATDTRHTLSFSNVFSVGSDDFVDIYFDVFEGTCGSLSNIACPGVDEVTTISGLTIGETYYIRVYSYYGAGFSQSFDMCIGTFPPPPANDNCSGALLVNSFPYNYTQADGEGATNNGGFVGACSYGMNDGTWFTFVGDGNTYNITVTTSSESNFDAAIGVYTGSCDNLVCQGNANNVGEGEVEAISIPTTAGTTYFVNVGSFAGYEDLLEGVFTINITKESTLGASETNGKHASIEIHPNPFVDDLNISDITKVKTVLVNDISGRLVKTIDNPGSSLHLGDLKSGMYLLTLEMKDGTRQSIKVIKR